jgi:hypothetical protein
MATKDSTSPAEPKGIKTDPQAQAEEDAGVRLPEGGTRQREPKPEDYPPSAKVTPAAEQLNTANSQVVGHAAPPEQGGAYADDIAEAAQATDEGIAAARERTEKAFDAKAKQEDADAKRNAS